MYIVRYSEIGLKGTKARDHMEQILVRNINKALSSSGIEANVKRSFGRIYITDETNEDDVSLVLHRIMGIKNYSRALSFGFNTLSDIADRSVQLWSQKLEGKSFAVRARRNGEHDFGSTDIMRSVGDALLPYSSRVDLTNPDVVVHIEVRDKIAYYFSELLPGPGGLPLGSEGKVVALVSGGIDSPVAAWSVMKRGSPVDLIFCSLAPPVDTIDFLKSAIPLIKNWGHGYNPRIHIIDGRILVEALADRTRFKISNVTFKRIIYLVAQEIARKSRAHGIVTGESLGQVSSQTPESLHATSHNLEVPVMRPLLSYDKDEIVALARKIGTFPETSRGEFCSLFAAHPITKPTIEELQEDMANFTLLDDLLASDMVLKGTELESFLSEINEADTEISQVPDNSVIIDLRAKEKFDKWHYPGAINMDLQSVGDMISRDDNQTYVFYCMKGLQSAYAASMARKAGTNAFYISEGKLRKKLEA